MKRSTCMNIMRGSLLVALTLFVLACGRDQTMASKSAAAYREAQAKGTPVSGGHEHGGHQATATTGTGEAMDHSAHGTAAGAMDHSAHGAMSGAATDQHAQHGQPSSAMEHAGHGTMQQSGASAPRVVLTAPTTNAEIARTQPAATLQPDDFDAPAPIAVAEAQKAAGGGGHEHGSASGTSQQTVYTCPMHPEVTSATPGTCPKCGMTLVKKEK